MHDVLGLVHAIFHELILICFLWLCVALECTVGLRVRSTFLEATIHAGVLHVFTTISL